MKANIRFLILLSLPVLVSPSRGLGQERVSLDDVETLMARGRILQARELLEGWWEVHSLAAGRVERQRSLWLRACLTVDPSMAEQDFRRLVLEFPGGPYSDDALLRLAQSAEVRGDLREAHSHYSGLLRGYPTSPHAPLARDWIRARGTEADAMGPVPPPSRQPPPDPGPGAVAGDFAVQLGAFRSSQRAEDLARRARGAGYEPRLVRVPGTDLVRVRVGRFRDRDGAEALRREVEGAGFEATIVTDAGSEERVG